MIIEGLLTTVDARGTLNLAPMGPVVDDSFQHLTLRPFQPSTTFNNLAATRCAVFHVVDQVDVIARAAVGRLTEMPAVERARSVNGFVLSNCCRWYEVTVDSIDASKPRSLISTTVVDQGERRAFLGFNRARHAVLEAAILATRVHLLPWNEIEAGFQFLEPAVLKTGDREELESFDLLKQFVWSKKDAAA